MLFKISNPLVKIIYLNYNAGMKKLVILFSLLLCSGSFALAEDSKVASLKSFFDKIPKQESMQSTPDDGYTLSQQATLLYNENDSKKAMETLLTIPETKRTADDWLLLGNMLQDQNRNSDAIFMYQRAILLNPKFYKAYYNLGNIYLSEEKPFLAIENYKKANRANSEFSYSYYNLGCAYIQAGDLKRAKIVFLKAIEIKNTEPDFHYNLAYVYKKLNKPKLSKQYLGFYNKLMEAKNE